MLKNRLLLVLLVYCAASVSTSNGKNEIYRNTVKDNRTKKSKSFKEKYRWYIDFLPNWKKIKGAATKAILAPETWVPLAGAIMLGNSLDHEILEWASDNTPVFGTQRDGLKASDTLTELSYKLNFATALLVPESSTRDLALSLFADPVNARMTGFFKATIKRERPHRENNDSLPSGHTSRAAVNCMMAYRNLKYVPIPGFARTTLRIGLLSLTSAVAWARIEGKIHWPRDVLAGAFLGNFVGNFMFNLFVERQEELSEIDNEIILSPSREGIKITLNKKF